MNISVDKNITSGKEAFSTIGTVDVVDGRSLTNRQSKYSDALVVRSVTNVNEELLKNTPVKFVATATIGTDHLDKEYLDSAGIKYFSAPGCNSTAVTEYILSALSQLLPHNNKKFGESSIGIIGVGNIGSKLARAAELLGMQVVLNDPPREKMEKSDKFSSLEAALRCDIVSFHTPLTREGEYKTYHLLNEQNINLIKPGAIILNASRGAVTKNSVLLNRISQKNDITLALDVWENEPNISTELLKLVNIATPHIAGYSLEGKVNGTYACYKNLCDFTGVSQLWQPDLPEIEEYQINVTELSTEEALSEIFNKIYNISSDDKSLRNYSGDIAVYFDNLRKTYPVRRESKGYDVKSDDEVIIKLMNYLAGI
ncbi:MAG: erythronate-4-phosphate dehydrogenase [Melioribacteraceae bacterium]|nr:MAG: erythronate-4-phosphate dehydrogenase [Melioribacteraceae bacterium]